MVNQQGPWIFDPDWRSAREGKTLGELRGAGVQFVVSDNRRLPFATGFFDEVITNGVPVDQEAFHGPGIPSAEVRRILKPGGRWVHDSEVRETKP